MQLQVCLRLFLLFDGRGYQLANPGAYRHSVLTQKAPPLSSSLTQTFTHCRSRSCWCCLRLLLPWILSCLQLQLAALLQQWRPAHLPALLVLCLDLERTLTVVLFLLQLSRRGLPRSARTRISLRRSMKNGVRSPPSVESALLIAKTAYGSHASHSS